MKPTPVNIAEREAGEKIKTRIDSCNLSEISINTRPLGIGEVANPGDIIRFSADHGHANIVVADAQAVILPDRLC